ncbi:hypothetical protein [Deinococcus sp. 12RED42]|uniref:hypothetical protein n=1 Tax=Deinococcus sp. 12RED42 TaxID=2745872 RepID=UPI001E2FCD8D|nr:hypothetical protein [Deinococcus sp. 12RED42]MCD0164876.1 hypothetical protein [Deinococcus sp. 12RED42]
MNDEHATDDLVLLDLHYSGVLSRTRCRHVFSLIRRSRWRLSSTWRTGLSCLTSSTRMDLCRTALKTG